MWIRRGEPPTLWDFFNKPQAGIGRKEFEFYFFS
jgi:hypothetical protein